ncbi:MAG: portal protein [Armatimonadota bacterium]
MASSKNDELIARLDEMVHDAQDAVRGLHDGWKRYINFYQGQQEEGVALKAKDLADWTPVNLIFSQCETKLPILMDAAPQWWAVSPDEENDENAKLLSEALQAKWYERNISRQYKLTLRDQIILGSGFLKCWWNPLLGPQGPTYGDDEKSDPQGDIDVTWIDPYSVYPDPAARNLEECEFVCLSSDMVEDRAKRLYPDKFDPEKAQSVAVDADNDPATAWDRGKAWLKSMVYSLVGDGSTQRRKMLRVWEVYHDAGARLTIFSGQNILWDGSNPTPNNRFPIVHFSSYEQGCDFWGMAETSQLIGLQTAINKQVFRIAKHARLMGNTPWVTDDPQLKVTNIPGEVMRVGLGRFARRDPPPPLPAYIFNFLNTLLQHFDVVTGVHDVTRGLKPGSVQSGVGIQQLQEAAQTRLRRASLDNALILQQLGQLVFDLMQAKYTGTRATSYLKGAQSRRVEVTQDMLHNTTPSPYDASGEDDIQEPVAYQIIVQQEGDLPLNPMAEAELAMRAASMTGEDGQPMIDREAFLEAIRFAGARALLERINTRTQGAQQGQALAQQEQEQAAQQQMEQQAMMQSATPQEQMPAPSPSGPEAAPPADLGTTGQAPMPGPQIDPQAGAIPPDMMQQIPPQMMQGMPPEMQQQMAEGLSQTAPAAQPEMAQGRDDEIEAELQQMLSPEDMQRLEDILTRVIQSGDVDEEDGAWLDTLPEEAQALIAELLDMMGVQLPPEDEDEMEPEGFEPQA